MKPGIEQNMEIRINEITEQATVFDQAISAIEETLSVTMEPTTSNIYTATTDGWTITAQLDESLYDGVVTVGVNKEIIGGSARFASMTITSQRATQESYNNIDSVVNHTYIMTLFGAIFEAVKITNSDTQVNAE